MDAISQPAPFVCRFNAFTPEQKVRYGELRTWLRSGTQKIAELPDGFAFHLDPGQENVSRAAEFAYLEGICCPFLSFSLQIGEDHGSLSLALTGREGVKAFLALELDLKV